MTDNKLTIIERWGKYADMIYEDVLFNDWDLEDWSTKNEYGEYEENSYINDDNDFIEIVKICLDLKDKIKSNLYRANGEELIQLSDNHTMFYIHKDIDIEEYWNRARDKFIEFERITGTEIYTEGRMARHICVDNTLINAYRYDELCNIQQRLEQELIDEINEGE